MIPKIARISLNVLLGIFYGCLIAAAAGFLGGFAIGFGGSMATIEDSAQGMIYGFSGLVGLVVYIYLMVKYRKNLFIHKQ